MQGDVGIPDALDGLRVLELGRDLGVAAAGLALTALGADVAQVVFGDRRLPRPESVYYDRGRTRVPVDEARPLLGVLASSADVILTDLMPGELHELDVAADADQLRRDPIAQVLVAVSSLGRTGPNAGFAMTDLTEWASTGLAQITRRPHDDLERYVPVLPPGCQPQALAGLAAATAAIVGRRWARSAGEPVVADVSVQEVVAAMLHGIFPTYVWNGVVTGHPDTKATALGMLLPAADGDVYIRAFDPRQWDALVAWVDNDTVATLGADADSRLANNDALVMLIGEWSATQLRHDLLEEGQRRHIPIALPRSLDDVLAWQQLRARGVWRDVELDGRRAVVPRVPLLEPPSWSPTEDVPVEMLATAWRATS